MSKKVHLLSIDPQNDFCDPTGNLYVTNAEKDMNNLAEMIIRLTDNHKLDDIHVTLDSHQLGHIANPMFWQDKNCNHPKPFTAITVSDVENGIWGPIFPHWRDKFLGYLRSLENNKRYIHVIWPPHCIIGSWGHSIYPCVEKAIQYWAYKEKAFVDYVAKGSNPWTEHFSAVKADVPDNDPSTQINSRLIDILNNADIILITGEALSHCVANTIRDIANEFGDDNIKKFFLVEDTTSSVTGFEKMGEDFVNEMVSKGMNIVNSKTVLA